MNDSNNCLLHHKFFIAYANVDKQRKKKYAKHLQTSIYIACNLFHELFLTFKNVHCLPAFGCVVQFFQR